MRSETEMHPSTACACAWGWEWTNATQTAYESAFASATGCHLKNSKPTAMPFGTQKTRATETESRNWRTIARGWK
jgi:hypothetical protein